MVGLGLILIFGRSGVVNQIVEATFGIELGRFLGRRAAGPLQLMNLLMRRQNKPHPNRERSDFLQNRERSLARIRAMSLSVAWRVSPTERLPMK